MKTHSFPFHLIKDCIFQVLLQEESLMVSAFLLLLHLDFLVQVFIFLTFTEKQIRKWTWFNSLACARVPEGHMMVWISYFRNMPQVSNLGHSLLTRKFYFSIFPFSIIISLYPRHSNIFILSSLLNFIQNHLLLVAGATFYCFLCFPSLCHSFCNNLGSSLIRIFFF